MSYPTAGFLISASVDFAPHVRLDTKGRDTDSRVRANMKRMIESGAVCGAAVVLGRHNSGSIEEIHDALLDVGAAWLDVFPMFQPPREAPGGDLLLASPVESELARRMERFLRRAGVGEAIEAAW